MCYRHLPLWFNITIYGYYIVITVIATYLCNNGNVCPETDIIVPWLPTYYSYDDSWEEKVLMYFYRVLEKYLFSH